MAKPIRLAAIVESYDAGSPARHLVDRLSTGYMRRGTVHRPEFESVTIHAVSPVDAEAIDRRAQDYGLKHSDDVELLAAAADAIIVVPKGAGDTPSGALLDAALESARPGTRVFVHGALAESASAARRTADRAASRKLALLAGGYMPTTSRLPSIDLARDTDVTDALMVTVGSPGEAEFLAVDGLLPVIERRRLGADGTRRCGEAGVRSVVAVEGQAVWQAFDGRDRLRDLLAAALSRSDTPQGDPVKDGRTQDLLGLNLVEKLAVSPVLYRIEHHDGMRSAVLVANGVVGDINFAVGTRTGDVVSAQLLRPRAPQSEHWSTLAERVERFFLTGRPPWPIHRSILTAGLLSAFTKARTLPGTRLPTADLSVAYASPPESMYCRE